MVLHAGSSDLNSSCSLVNLLKLLFYLVQKFQLFSIWQVKYVEASREITRPKFYGITYSKHQNWNFRAKVFLEKKMLVYLLPLTP